MAGQVLESYQGNEILLYDSRANPEPWTSRASVVIVGHGADEVFGGYGRHKTCFKFGGLPRLQSELDQELARLWLRNLGRDDRVISDTGKESRHPFLDEEFLAFALSLELRCPSFLRCMIDHTERAICAW